MNAVVIRQPPAASVSSRAPPPRTERNLGIYQPLHDWQTRTLRIYPGDSSSPLVADLLVLDIVIGSGGAVKDDNGIKRRVDYIALSYTWGSSNTEDMHPLWVYPSGATSLKKPVEVQITKNLFGALRAFRAQYETVGNIWVDAISINQEDLQEKATQIPLMLDIYSKAISVMVWLGEGDPECGEGMRLLRQPDEKAEEEPEKESIKGDEDVSDESGDEENREDNDNTYRTTDDEGQRPHRKRLENEYKCILKVYNLPWMTRAWVRQEAYAAQSITVHYGEQQLHWPTFLNGPAVLKRRLRKLERIFKIKVKKLDRACLTRLRAFAEMTASESIFEMTKQPRDLFHVLSSTHHFSASWEQDSVYSILGMTGVKPSMEVFYPELDIRHPLVTISYERPISRVYEDITRALILNTIERKWSLGLSLIFQNHVPEERESDNSASWAIDWSNGALGYIGGKRPTIDPDHIMSEPVIGVHLCFQSTLLSTLFKPRDFPYSDEEWKQPFDRLSFATPHELAIEGLIYGQIWQIEHQGCDPDDFLSQFVPWAEAHRDFSHDSLLKPGSYQVASVLVCGNVGHALVGPSVKPGDFIFGFSNRCLPIVLRSSNSNVTFVGDNLKISFPDNESSMILRLTYLSRLGDESPEPNKNLSEDAMVVDWYNRVSTTFGENFTFQGPIICQHLSSTSNRICNGLRRQKINII
jgi:hypothetical protein